jgi:hypothetical protein
MFVTYRQKVTSVITNNENTNIENNESISEIAESRRRLRFFAAASRLRAASLRAHAPLPPRFTRLFTFATYAACATFLCHIHFATFALQNEQRWLRRD